MRIITDNIDKYDKDWWEKFYSLHHHTYNQDELEAFKAASDEIGDKMMIDVGCGEGFFAQFKENYFGLDWSEEAIKQARKNNPGKYFKAGDITEVKEKFDYALLSMVFEHLENPKDYVQEIRKIANKIVVIIPNGEMGSVCVENDKAILSPDFEDLDYHFATYTKEDIAVMYPKSKLLHENGTTLTFLI